MSNKAINNILDKFNFNIWWEIQVRNKFVPDLSLSLFPGTNYFFEDMN